MILWFGFYGFNAGSTLRAQQGAMDVAATAAVTTTLAATSAGIATALQSRYIFHRNYDATHACNGILTGLTAISAGSGCVGNGSAIIIGVLGSSIYLFSSYTLEKYGIDDPLEASSVHGAGGMWGVIAAGLFSTKKLIRDAYGI
eukprot:UN26857